MNFKPYLRYIIFFFSLLLLAGCFEEKVYTKLTEQEANEMLSLLNSVNIPAKKKELDKELYAVTVPNKLLSKSIDLLRSNGYPRNKFQSIGEVFEKQGFVSSPLEERARFNYAQSQELTKTLESIDGVVLARVHLALPEKDRLNKKQKPSSASVFIKHHVDVDLAEQESQVKSLVVNSIEGLPYENVTVAFFGSRADSIDLEIADPNNDSATLIFLMAGIIFLIVLYFLANKFIFSKGLDFIGKG